MALGNVHQKLGNFKTAIDCYQRRLKFAIELGERIGEAAANSNLGSALSTLGDFKTAINYHKRHLEISQELGDRSEKVQRMEILATLISIWELLKQP